VPWPGASQVTGVTVDGQPLEGTVIPFAAPGATIRVEVTVK
jgi:hypothetical protein